MVQCYTIATEFLLSDSALTPNHAEYYDVFGVPTPECTRKLYEDIQALYGCSGYPLKNLQNWFSKKRGD